MTSTNIIDQVKFSLLLSAVILFVGAAFGWHGRQQLVHVRVSHEKLVAEAALLGVSAGSGAPSDSARSTRRVREDKDAIARQTAAEFVAFAKEMEALQAAGENPDPEMQKRIMKFIGGVMDLDASQLKILIAEVRSAKDLKDETRKGLISFSIMTLASDHPQAALTIFTESSDLLGSGGMGNHVVSSSLAKWAKDDPLGALEWVRANSKKFPDLVNDDAKRGLMQGAAASDPKLAFKLIDELGFKERSQAVSDILSAARTGEQRTASLAALREYLPSLPEGDERDQSIRNALSGLTRGVAAEGFGAATRWLESANLTPVEMDGFAQGLHYRVKGPETGSWIEWIGEKLPPEKRDHHISQMVGQWTQKDFQATGAWLNQTPDGPVKHAAIRSYAETVAEYEPESAGQWAETLPQGKDRAETLKQIYENWPKNDDASKEAAAAFAKKHGIR